MNKYRCELRSFHTGLIDVKIVSEDELIEKSMCMWNIPFKSFLYEKHIKLLSNEE